MARVPFSPVPDVAAREEAPDDYQHIEASPNSFGAAAFEGLEQASAGAIDAAKFYGTVAADNATNNTLQQVTSVLYGNPNKQSPGPDGQMVADTGYFGKQGADAMAAGPEVTHQIDGIIADQRANLSTLQAQLEYDNQTRRNRANWMTDMGRHADQQQKVWAQDTNETAATINLNSVARVAADDDASAAYGEKVRAAYVKNAQLAGQDPQGAVLRADQNVALTRLRSLVVSNPPRAQEVLDKSGDLLGSLPQYDAITREVKEAVINAKMAPATGQFIDDVRAQAQQSTAGTVAAIKGGQGSLANIKTALLGQESGNNPNAPTSIQGAVGPGQIEPPTFARFAKPGEKITNPNDNRAVSGRYVDYLSALPNVRGDPARIAVGYFSGEGNIAPVNSPTPYVANWHDKTGKTTDSYVADVMKRTGTQQQGRSYDSIADYYAMNEGNILDKARDQAETLFPNYPDAQERFVTNVSRHLSQTITQQHAQYEVDVHTVEQAFASNHPPVTEDELNATSPQVALAWNRMQIDSPYQAAAVQNRFAAAAKGQAKTYGSEFNTMLGRVLAPVGDPNRITNPAQLWPYVQPGEHGALTNTGASVLSDVMTRRQGPQGEADTALMRNFLANAHHMINPIQDERLGIFYPNGEKAFQSFVGQAFPMIQAEQKAGKPLSEILKDKGDVYNMALGFTKSPMQIMNARMNDVRYDPHAAAQRTLDATMKQVRSPDDLVGLYRSGKITREQFDSEAINRKWARAPEAVAPPQVPFKP